MRAKIAAGILALWIMDSTQVKLSHLGANAVNSNTLSASHPSAAARYGCSVHTHPLHSAASCVTVETVSQTMSLEPQTRI